MEKTACVAKLSAESLKWLLKDTYSRYDRLMRKSAGIPNSPFVFQSWDIYNSYWLYEVVKASILIGSYPLESKGANSLAPDRKTNPEFNKLWPKAPGATAFWGAGMSTAEAISEALFKFLKKSFLWNFPDLPNYIALNPGLCEPYDKEKLEREFNETGDVRPLISTGQNLSIGSVVEYISLTEWSSAEVDKEYSRVLSLLNHKINQVQLPKQAGTERETSGGKAGETKTESGNKTQKNEIDYRIEDLGNQCVLYFKGNGEILPNQIGSDYIVYLLTHKDKDISAIQLESACKLKPNDLPKNAEDLPEGTREVEHEGDLGDLADYNPEQIKSTIPFLEQKIEETDKQAEKQSYAEKIDKIKKYMANSINIYGKKRKTGDPLESARIRVTQAISAVKGKIKDKNLKYTLNTLLPAIILHINQMIRFLGNIYKKSHL